MMQRYSKLLGLVPVLLAWACAAPSQDEKLLKEAADVHNTALQIAEDLESRLKQEAIPADSAFVILAAIEEWEQDLIEVPGNEHHHDHEGHNHSHEPVNVTAAEMLELQLELKQRIEQIKKRVDALTP
ncbi:MAG: hypothetical protein KIT62_08155 [Cyclobacteriaceae bacterium]|nr:hypothetical protein [Cyclobacteriaceae bacterium]